MIYCHSFQNLDESKAKRNVQAGIVLTWSYFSLNVLYAILLVVESANLLNGNAPVSN